MKKAIRPQGQRQLRVSEELRHALARVIERSELRDPELAGISITVSEVRISPDLRNATVFVAPLGGEARSIIPPLKRAAPFLRRRVADLVNLRHVPNLTFEADLSFDNASHIGNILNRIHGDANPDEPDAEEDNRGS